MYALICAALLLGLADATPFSKIVNGTDAEPGEFPYIVSVRLFKMHNCGGSILNPYFVMTAGHCATLFPAIFFTVQYGVTDISADSTNSIAVEKKAIHEHYDPEYWYINDIAILKLISPIPLGELAQPINLPLQDQGFAGWSLATLVGWGHPYTGGSTMKHLQKVNILIYPHDECDTAHEGKIDELNHVCAGVPEGGKGQCSGDSGGPLTVDGVQVGIVSWSVKPCTLIGYPGVFTRVAHHIDWIRDKINTM